MTGVPSSSDLHELLLRQDFVHRLARSLVFDQERVDDVVQEAWLAAVQNPPRQAAAAPGWFRRVLHNLARRRARDEARRAAREAAAARPEALPSAADVVAREAQRREVVEAVLGLPEPYRGTVLARFFDDREPAAIARLRGVPAATVRSQLARGLQLLRERMDARHGDRRSWCLLLLPLARPARVAGTGVGAAAGALLMGKVLVGIGALALMVLCMLWWNGREVAPTTMATATDNGAPVATAGEGPAVPPAAAERVPVGEAPVGPAAGLDPGVAGLRGRVVHVDGAPAAGCAVRVLGLDGLTRFAGGAAAGGASLPLVRREVRTAEDGTFLVRDLVPRAQYVLHGDADGPDPTLRTVDVTPVVGEVVDIGDFVLVGKGLIRGRAIDADGRGVAGAEVTASDLPGAIAALVPLERFAPEHGGMLMLPLPDATMTATDQGNRLREFLRADLLVRTDLDRDPGLRAFVVERLPWLEAVWRELPLVRTTTQADGSFVLGGVPPGSNVVTVRLPGRLAGQLPRVVVRAGATIDVGDVRLVAGEELRGTVRDAGGVAVAAAEVRVAPLGPIGGRGIAFAGPPTRSDAAGAFRLGGLPRGRALVAVRSRPGVPWHVTGPVAVDDELVITLPATSPLRVRVVAPAGQPQPVLEVELLDGPPLGELRALGLQPTLARRTGLTVDDDGVGEVGALPPGCYTLHCRADGIDPVIAMTTLPQTEPLRLELRAARPLALHVRDAGQRAVAGAGIYVPRHEGFVLPADFGLAPALPMDLAGATDLAGTCRLAVRPGWTMVYVLHPQHAPRMVEVEAAATDVDVVLAEHGAVSGRLFDHGVPADPRRWRVVARPDVQGQLPLPAVTAALRPDGTFRFPCLAPAPYRLRAVAVDRAELTMHGVAEGLCRLADAAPWRVAEELEKPVEVKSGATATVEFDTDPNQPAPGVQPARLRGRVLEDGRPLAGLLLQRLVTSGADGSRPSRYVDLTTVGADGTFVVAALEPGRQQLRLQEPKGNPVWDGEVDLAPARESVLELVWSTGRITGTASFANGLPSEQHVVTANGRCAGGRVRRYALIDASGHFAFTGLPAGDYEFVASGPVGRSTVQRAVIAAGVEAPALRVVLEERPALAGRVELGGRKVRKVMIGIQQDNTTSFQEVGSDGRFRFVDVMPQVYSILLDLDDQEVAAVPGSVDLSQGPVGDLVVRPAASAK